MSWLLLLLLLLLLVLLFSFSSSSIKEVVDPGVEGGVSPVVEEEEEGRTGPGIVGGVNTSTSACCKCGNFDFFTGLLSHYKKKK